MDTEARKAVFLDRDGTIIHDQHYGCDPDAIRLADGAIEGLRLLQGLGYRLVVITNQSGVARGFFTEDDLALMHQRLAEILAAEGINISAFYHCPHHPDGSVAGYRLACDCRKPRPGMILRACADLGIEPSRSWMVGDILDDVEAGKTAGCRAVLIDLGTEGEPQSPERTPEYVAANLLDAACHISLHAEKDKENGKGTVRAKGWESGEEVARG